MIFIDFITIRHWLLRQTLILLVYFPSSLFQFMLFIGLVQPWVISATLQHYSQHCFHIYQESLWCDIGRSLIVKPFVFSETNSLHYSLTPANTCVSLPLSLTWKEDPGPSSSPPPSSSSSSSSSPWQLYKVHQKCQRLSLNVQLWNILLVLVLIISNRT